MLVAYIFAKVDYDADTSVAVLLIDLYCAFTVTLLEKVIYPSRAFESSVFILVLNSFLTVFNT